MDPGHKARDDRRAWGAGSVRVEEFEVGDREAGMGNAMRVVIIGGGIGGLTLALMLQGAPH